MRKVYAIICFFCSIKASVFGQIYIPDNGKDVFYYPGCSEELVNIPLSDNRNGVIDITYRSKDGTKTSKKVQYFDGLGRLIEDISVGATPQKNDLVVWHEYDGNGSPSKTWLPAVIPSAGNGFHLESSVREMSISTNGNDGCPYEEKIYETNPLGRLMEQFGPGEEWRNKGKSVKTEYLTNVSGDTELNCIKILIPLNLDRPRVTGDFPSGSLQVLKTTNEDGEILLEFRDNLDRVLLSRRLMQYGDDPLDTYYIYDGFNLRFVLPPSMSKRLKHNTSLTTSFLNNSAYCYRYDGRNRLISKQFPGAEKVLMSYDQADRLIFSQNGEQRKRDVCTFYLYDVYGRECVMGECTKELSTSGSPINDYVRCDYTKTGPYMGYTLTGVDLVDAQILSVKYYDSYDYLSDDSLRYVNDETFGLLHTHPRGLETGSVSALLDDSITYETASFYYDEYSRMIQSHKTNHLGGYDHEFVEYSFPGEMLRRKLVHTAGGKLPVVQLYTNTYDDEGRLLKTTHSFNGAAPITLASYEYDEFGRMKCNSRNGKSGMSTNYDYNIRSWMTAISSDTFTESMAYTQPSAGATPRYGGKISEIVESHGNLRTTPKDYYTFFYDRDSRLQDAHHRNSSSGELFGTHYEYDSNGNITHLLRNGLDEAGKATVWDNLSLIYNGSHLLKVTNTASPILTYNSMNFSDGSDESGEYSYDKNGNMTKDSNRKISSIQYNILNLPQRIKFTNTAYEKMTYSINGEKVQVKKKNILASDQENLGDLEPIGPSPLPDPGYPIRPTMLQTSKLSKSVPVFNPVSTMDYCGNIVYKDGQLYRLSVDGGYVTFKDDGTPSYHYYLTDHLGNNRVVLSAVGAVEQVNQFYPFGASRPDSRNEGQTQPYKYNGKELDTYENLFWYDYSARTYDPILARFTTMDPLAEKYYNVSPYAYCMNDPVNYVDPDGKKPTIYEAALMAKHVYGDDVNLAGGWHISKTQYASFNSEKSGLRSALYERTKNGVTEYAYVTAGTEDFQDVKEDVTQLLGKGAQYEQSIDNAKILNTSIKDSELTFVGHSLGGGLAAANALATRKNAITFNPAAITAATKKNLHIPSATSNDQILNVIVKGEIVSYLQSKIGLKAEGHDILLDAKYLPCIDPINTGLRVYNHLINTVIDKLEEEK